jgi:4-hydroxy-2-oxoheptanedioate aldolase
VNGWLSIGNAFTAEIMAEQGFDSLTIDLQHGFLDYSDAKPMLAGATGKRCHAFGARCHGSIPALS